MKKLTLFLLLVFILVGCSSVNKDVDELIGKGKLSEAANLIDENDLLNKKNEDAKYNYKSLIKYLELKKLYDQKEYQKVLSQYTSKPIKDDFIKKEVYTLVKGSFDDLISKKYFHSVERYYDKLDKDTKENFKDVYLSLMKNKQENESAQVATSLSPFEQYLKYMEEGNYAKLTQESTTDITNVGENFFNLGTAYDNFYNNNDLEYIKGQESLPETFLNSITNPLPELKSYISKLRKEIETRKKGSTGKTGVSIGMTKDMVLKSSWGEPQKINKTTTSYGTKEQWVYGNGNYFYFENGILTTIQN
ncbi:hypothetical protein [Neobacillus sp. SuZ13]|uniref:hypothetical protein n=1 Tax=Neobacillus sp. SuZ13 TaxID=3047875 RepID=UPI0024BFACF0|nr:hypothetical protein [Neobacillus sp. SuZ13]WHY64669.1 hypothetical protein QNH17_16205 [Neobacillus sp. SuZ13]